MFLQSSQRFFSMHFHVQIVSFCQVEHVATQQPKIPMDMRGLVFAEEICLIELHSVPSSCPPPVALSKSCVMSSGEVLCDPELATALPPESSSSLFLVLGLIFLSN